MNGAAGQLNESAGILPRLLPGNARAKTRGFISLTPGAGRFRSNKVSRTPEGATL